MSQKLSSGKLNPNSDCVAVIMAGGQGTRFWPLSRRAFPKQYMKLAENEPSLIRQTANRVSEFSENTSILVVTAETQRELVAEHVPEAVILSEPEPKNTAPCVGYAALKVLLDVGDVPMLVLPADHTVGKPAALQKCFEKAIYLAQNADFLVTIGIPPSYPETGYGYIRRGIHVEGDVGKSVGAHFVRKFVEKPDLDLAKRYCESREYFWNSGMFAWRPSVILDAIQKTLPEHAKGLEQIRAHLKKEDEAGRARGFFGV